MGNILLYSQIIAGIWALIQMLEWIWNHRQRFIRFALRLRALCVRVWRMLQHAHR